MTQFLARWIRTLWTVAIVVVLWMFFKWFSVGVITTASVVGSVIAILLALAGSVPAIRQELKRGKK